MNQPTASGIPESKSTQYRSYILRLWSTDRGEAAGWHASLEDPETGKRIGFASLEELFVFLMDLHHGSVCVPVSVAPSPKPESGAV